MSHRPFRGPRQSNRLVFLCESGRVFHYHQRVGRPTGSGFFPFARSFFISRGAPLTAPFSTPRRRRTASCAGMHDSDMNSPPGAVFLQGEDQPHGPRAFDVEVPPSFLDCPRDRLRQDSSWQRGSTPFPGPALGRRLGLHRRPRRFLSLSAHPRVRFRRLSALYSCRWSNTIPLPPLFCCAMRYIFPPFGSGRMFF